MRARNPIKGVTVTLGGTATATATTDATGLYTFSNLLPGTYTVTETQPAGYFDGKDTVGTVNGSSTGVVLPDGFDQIVLTYNDVGIDYNFGELAAASLSGFVYVDEDNDGVKDRDEGGLATTVTLTGTDDMGAPVSLTTVEQRNEGRLQLHQPAAGHVCDCRDAASGLSGREGHGRSAGWQYRGKRHDLEHRAGLRREGQ